MNRSEKDLRDALGELDRRAVEHGAPSTDAILDRIAVVRAGHQRRESDRRVPRWIPPLAAAAVVAAAGVTAAVIATGSNGPSHHDAQAGGSSAPTQSAAPRPSRSRTAAPSSSPVSSSPVLSTPVSSKSVPVQVPPAVSTSVPAATATYDPPANPRTRAAAAAVLEGAATRLDAMPPSRQPGADEYYYRKTTDAVSWTSVSGRKPGAGHNSEGMDLNIPGCRHGRYVGGGTSGSCTLNDVPHYRADAPTTPSPWDAYLEKIAPGAKAADAQGKIIVGVLHEDLISPAASAALLRYTETCPGLHLVQTKPVDGEQLTGVSCTSMTNGSYGLAFDASSHAFVGFVPVDYQTGKQDDTAEIVRRTAIVKAIGDKP